ncbi:glucokinase [Isoptericola sp. CG 20/1183]|uniref:Glucokinase n=1 Tax=Isoptericola halotolerans TaxID=300560 RepID=A0ABX5EH88_9MICO|nr:MULTISPECIES: ROK family protein [Isoptericola]PRZ08863.1 glucokinase [Isoptericola halotolerans]PRZ10690.1 glucokinase [Isoptericola sp. CG 20/1183]
MSGARTTAVGLDIGGTKMCAVALDVDGKVRASLEVPTPAAQGPAAILDLGASLVRSVDVGDGSGPSADDDAPSARRTLRLGVGTAGVVDRGTGTILSATSALPGWAGTPVRDELAARLGGALVTVVNDVHAVAAAESRWGSAASTRDHLVLTVGTGIGGAVVVDGEVLVGSRRLAGHVGHMSVPEAVGEPCPCGRTGHLEAVASGPAMVAAYRALGGRATTGKDLARAVAHGDGDARRVLRRAGSALGTAIASLAAALDPQVVVVGGGALRVGADLLDAAHRSLAASALPGLADLPLVRAAVRDGGAVGAASLALPARGRPPHEDLRTPCSA